MGSDQILLSSVWVLMRNMEGKRKKDGLGRIHHTSMGDKQY